MRRWGLVLLLSALTPLVCAKDTHAQDVLVHGKIDGNAPAWSISTDLPKGWTQDCCTYAATIGASLVLYQGAWTGKPERVMVLNVWPAKLPTLDAELQDDRQHYLQSDTHGKANPFPLKNPRAIACQGVLYQGSDHIDDVVVFCDPGKKSGIRYSWSMTFSAADPNRRALVDTFKQVVQDSVYMTYVPESKSSPTAAAKP
jgi:hypothetical protein